MNTVPALFCTVVPGRSAAHTSTKPPASFWMVALPPEVSPKKWTRPPLLAIRALPALVPAPSKMV
jgi:hypothetical protein